MLVVTIVKAWQREDQCWTSSRERVLRFANTGSGGTRRCSDQFCFVYHSVSLLESSWVPWTDISEDIYIYIYA